MKIIKTGIAGTLESGDLTVKIEPNTKEEIKINLVSSVEIQFGEDIKKVILETLMDLGISSAIVQVNDKGALNCTIIARLKTAIFRACDIDIVNWEVKRC